MSFTKNKKTEIAESIKAVIEYFTQGNADQEVIKNTPARFANYLATNLAGYNQSGKEVLSKTFPNTHKYNSFLVCKNIEFSSICQHHLLPIIGTATVAYFPTSKLVGLSKLARLVDIFASRLQLQEKMTQEIGNEIKQHLPNNGIAVHIAAKHMCMSIRGPKKTHSATDTFYFTEKFEDPEQQRLFLDVSRRK